MPKTADIRFFEELNDFLPPGKRKIWFSVVFSGSPAVKDVIESLGVPHTEIDLIIVDGVSVGFAHHLSGGERIAVYPVFESLDISPLVRLRATPLRVPRFILDAHLGKLARYLRLAGFDSLYNNRFEDREIIEISLAEHRAILTRDIGILRHGAVTHGYRVRSTHAPEQLREVIERFDLADSVTPFVRCLVCNGLVAPVAKEDILPLLEPKTATYFDEFHRCGNCGKVYWKGSHYEHMAAFITRLRDGG